METVILPVLSAVFILILVLLPWVIVVLSILAAVILEIWLSLIIKITEPTLVVLPIELVALIESVAVPSIVVIVLVVELRAVGGSLSASRSLLPRVKSLKAFRSIPRRVSPILLVELLSISVVGLSCVLAPKARVGWLIWRVLMSLL